MNASPDSIHDICVFFQIAQDNGEKTKGDPIDLRLDIEHRKKYCCQGSHCNHDHDRDRGDSQACGREKPAENSSTSHERAKCVDLPLLSIQSDPPPTLGGNPSILSASPVVSSRKSQKKRSRSSSSSSSSSSEPQQEDSFAAKSNPEDKSFHAARAGQNEPSLERGKPHGGIVSPPVDVFSVIVQRGVEALIIKSQQVRVRGRGWNRISFQGNSSHRNNVTNMSANPSKVEWDPEYTPKSRNYYLV